jgi:HAD superfamily hydrolase (TIGR01549 family)
VGIIRGTLHAGRREAAGFVSLPWVREQIAAQVGFRPFPGTLNLKVDSPESEAAWQRLRQANEGWVLTPSDPDFCAASCWPIRIEGIVPGAIVWPHVPGYPEDVVEVVAALNLRDRLGIEEGDPCTLHLGQPPAFARVLFDMEGTLVDFQWKLAEAEEALRAAVAALGYDRAVLGEENYAGIRRKAMECAPTQEARAAIDQRLAPIYDHYDLDALSRWQLREDAPGLLRELSTRGVRFGVVTNIGRRGTDGALARFGLESAFGVVITRDDVEQLKPDGAGIRRALRALGDAGPLEPALMVGDSLSDLYAARDAGISVAIVAGGETPARTIRAHRPDYCLPRLRDVRELIRPTGR